MPQEQCFRGDGAGALRRNSSRRLYRSDIDMDDRGWTSLHVVAKKGDLNKVKQLLDEGLDVNISAWGPKSQGVTPLHLAAQGGHLKVMDVLLEHGANIDARTKGACGWTPLHNAAKERNKKAIRFLLENGAFLPEDINDTRFNPPLHYCLGLELAYDEMKRLQEDTTSASESKIQDILSRSQLIGKKSKSEGSSTKIHPAYVTEIVKPPVYYRISGTVGGYLAKYKCKIGRLFRLIEQ